VVVERRRGDAGVVGDLADPGGGISAGGEETDRSVANAGSCIGVSLGYRSID
jgi:hypothetical protein